MDDPSPQLPALAWAALDSLPHPTVLTDSQGIVVWTNRSARSRALPSGVDPVGRPIAEAFAASDLAEAPARELRANEAAWSLVELRDREAVDLLLAAGMTVWTIDVESGGLTAAEPAPLPGLGYSAAALRAPGFLRHVVHPLDAAEFFGAIAACSAAGQVREVAARLYSPSGAPIWVQGYLRAEAGRPGQVIAALSIGNDLRVLRERLQTAEQQLSLSEKSEALSLLAGGVAHELNNIIQVIQGNNSLVLMEMTEADRRWRFLRHVDQSCQEALALSRDLMLFAGRRHARLEPVHLTAMVGEQIEALKALAGTHILLHFSAGPGLPTVEGDRALLTDSLRLMVTNAREGIGSASGTIQVRTGIAVHRGPAPADCFLAENYREGPCVYLEVTDSGTGLSEASRRRIFDPWFSTRGKARGPGLAPVLATARAHRAFLRVASEAGRGCSIRLCLPQPEAATLPGAGHREEPAAARPAVLLADADAGVLELLGSVLARAGWPVLPARTDEEAMGLLREHSKIIGLVVLDLGLSGSGGLAFFRRLRERLPELPALLIGGAPPDPWPPAEDPRVDFLAKPFSPRELQHKAHSMVRSSPRHDNRRLFE